jgi:superfamily II DNA helicase RecQ
MAFRFFQIPARGCDQAESELNGYLETHRVLAVDRRWVDLGDKSFWAVCVDSLDRQNRADGGGQSAGSRNRVDYREVLSAEDFTKFVAVRDVRKQIAQADGIPVYAIMTNEQIAQAIKRGVCDKAGLLSIPGVGEAKVDKFGLRILECLRSLQGPEHAADGKSVREDSDA